MVKVMDWFQQRAQRVRTSRNDIHWRFEYRIREFKGYRDYNLSLDAREGRSFLEHLFYFFIEYLMPRALHDLHILRQAPTPYHKTDKHSPFHPPFPRKERIAPCPFYQGSDS